MILVFACFNGFLAAGALTMWTVWKRFRHEFLGLRESMAELKEDLIWLREWVEVQKDSSSDDDAI